MFTVSKVYCASPNVLVYHSPHTVTKPPLGSCAIYLDPGVMGLHIGYYNVNWRNEKGKIQLLIYAAEVSRQLDRLLLSRVYYYNTFRQTLQGFASSPQFTKTI